MFCNGGATEPQRHYSTVVEQCQSANITSHKQLIMDIHNRVVIITGASSGIGAATARMFANEGARLVLAARREGALNQVAASLRPGTEAIVIPTDVGDEEAVKNLVDQALQRFGTIDVLVNNAGYGAFAPITDLSAEKFDDILRVNLRGVFLCTKYVLPHFYQKQAGSVVTVSSLAGKHGFSNGAAYCASKFGVMGLMESVFHEARSHNVRVITLTPGSVDTPFFDGAGVPVPNRDRIPQADEIAEVIRLAVALPERTLIRELDIRPTNPKG